MSRELTMSSAQLGALAHVRERAAAGRDEACARIAAILARSSVDRDVASILHGIAEHSSARVTLNFHPDRLRADGSSVAEGLLREGRYLNQFETGVTNGSPTAFVGGERDRWENELFGGAYQRADVLAVERPKYGALNLMQHPDGGSPRFGSCHFVLRRSAVHRCTFTWGDSHEAPEYVGTIDSFASIGAALFEAVASTGEALGESNVGVAELLRILGTERGARGVGRALDAYIEAEVHGAVRMSDDVDALVVDASFQQTQRAMRWSPSLRRSASRCATSLRSPSRCRTCPSTFEGHV